MITCIINYLGICKLKLYCYHTVFGFFFLGGEGSMNVFEIQVFQDLFILTLCSPCTDLVDCQIILRTVGLTSMRLNGEEV